MDLFDLFWPGGRFHWYDLLFQVASIFVGLYLLLLAGLAFMQLYRRPRETRLFLAAIGLALFNMWVPWRVSSMFIMVIGSLGNAQNIQLISFMMNVLVALLTLVISGLIWWCLLKAAFEASPDAPGPDDAPGSAA